MAETVQNLINDCGKANGKIGAGRTLSESEFLDSLHIFQRMVDAWTLENLMMFSTTRRLFTLVPGKSPLTIGVSVGADFPVDRPIRITGLGLSLTSVVPPVETPLKRLTDDQWENTRVKTLASNLPTEVWYNESWPLGQIFLWPVPTEANSLVIYTLDQLASPVALTDSIDLPPGYEQAIVYEMAVSTCTLFQRPLTPELVEAARESKARIKRYNHRNDLMRVDEALTGNGRIPGIAQFYSGG